MMQHPEPGGGPANAAGAPRRSFVRQAMLVGGLVLLFAGFVALGTWQLYRLQWKLALIQRVNSRVHAVPAPAPGPSRWRHITVHDDEYRHVRVTGAFLTQCTTPVQAVTVLGNGYWLLTPLRRPDGSLYLINRGFVPADPVDQARDQHRLPADEACGRQLGAPVTVTGLLRMTEPGGGFLHRNRPAASRWYSRDVAAIAAARGLTRVAPYFIDADADTGVDATPGANVFGHPVGGLTVIHFRNAHLSYAMTWYTLALMVAGVGLWIARDARRQRRRGGGNGEADEAGES